MDGVPFISTRRRPKHRCMTRFYYTSTQISISARGYTVRDWGRKNLFFRLLFLISVFSEKRECSPKNYLRASLLKPRPLFKCPHIWLASGILIHSNYAELNAWGTFCPSLQWHANVFIMQKLANILLNGVFLLLRCDSWRNFVRNITTHFVASVNAFMNITF